VPEPLVDRRYLIPFRSPLLPQIFTDVLVIGGGVAGARAALAAASRGDVIVLGKDAAGQSSSAWAQGGIAAAIGPDDRPDAHAADTLEAGGGSNDPAAVAILADEAPAEVARLRSWGMRFDTDGERLDLGREGGHRRSRIVHAGGAATGVELMRTLRREVAAAGSIRWFDGCFAIDLLTSGQEPPRVVGAITHHPRHGLQIIWAKATILATGGLGQVFRETTNPPACTGDGIAMAWRAGAAIADLEFVQFHPTVLYIAGATRALVSEAVRGEGAVLVDRDGRRFMEPLHPMGELAPRDVVSRAIAEDLARRGDSHVWLDLRPIGAARFAARFPGLDRLVRSFGLDPATDPIPVHPAAHYTIGGVRCDLEGRTSLPGLFACGETACSGVHGANRLASNSLLEGLVFGRRTGEVAAREEAAAPPRIISEVATSGRAELDLADARSSLRSAVWRHAGIVRTGSRLEDLLDMLDFWGRYCLDKIFDDPQGWEIQNMIASATLLAKAALFREESRGTHWRADFPQRAACPPGRSLWRRGGAVPGIEAIAGLAAEPQAEAVG
jgi:L-aspartate oxidase